MKDCLILANDLKCDLFNALNIMDNKETFEVSFLFRMILFLEFIFQLRKWKPALLSL